MGKCAGIPMNKNTRQLKKAQNKACRTGSNPIVSQNKRRNMQERILRNSGGGAGSSLTVHEPIHKDRPVVFLNHAYIAKDNGYTQPVK